MINGKLNKIFLREADRIEITILMDNYTDLILPSSENVKRQEWFFKAKDNQKPPIAEHGLSQLIRIEADDERHTILMDAGFTEFGTPYNARSLGIDLSGVEAIIISHGHNDHIGGLEGLLELISKRPLPLVLHPHALLKTRYTLLKDNRKKRLIPLDEKALSKKGFSFVKAASPYILASGLLSTTGQIDRLNDFEQSLPGVYMEENGVQKRDLILDDQAIVLILKGKGLVIVSGCAHSGIINTIRHAQMLTEIERVHAVVGGFHLSGKFYEGKIERTIDELEHLNPSILVPNHCTGWKALNSMAKRMPHSFLLSSVGTTFILM